MKKAKKHRFDQDVGIRWKLWLKKEIIVFVFGQVKPKTFVRRRLIFTEIQERACQLKIKQKPSEVKQQWISFDDDSTLTTSFQSSPKLIWLIENSYCLVFQLTNLGLFLFLRSFQQQFYRNFWTSAGFELGLLEIKLTTWPLRPLQLLNELNQNVA